MNRDQMFLMLGMLSSLCHIGNGVIEIGLDEDLEVLLTEAGDSVLKATKAITDRLASEEA